LIDMRYHVISLVAVFLALGIGILLGTTLVERGLIAEQKSQIKSLRKTFGEIKEKNKSLHAELEAYQEFSDQARPYMTANRLAGRTLAVLSTDDLDDRVVGKVSEAVSGAGGSIPLTVILPDPALFDDAAVKESLSQLFQVPPQPALLKDRTYAEVVTQLKSGSNPAMLSELARLGVIQIRGTFPGAVSAAILIASKKSSDPKYLENADLPLARAMVAVALPAVGVGGAETPEAVLEGYKQSGISTVDHVDTSPGQVAMVMVLEGRGGNYGSGKAAERMIPEPSGI